MIINGRVRTTDDVALLIRAVRLERGLRQRDLAKLIGSRQPEVSAWEAGVVVPSLLTLLRILDALACDIAISERS